MSAIKNEIIEQENVRQKKNPSFALIKKLFKSGIMARVNSNKRIFFIMVFGINPASAGAFVILFKPDKSRLLFEGRNLAFIRFYWFDL